METRDLRYCDVMSGARVLRNLAQSDGVESVNLRAGRNKERYSFTVVAQADVWPPFKVMDFFVYDACEDALLGANLVARDAAKSAFLAHLKKFALHG